MKFPTIKRAVFSLAAGLFALSMATQALAFCISNDILSKEKLNVQQMTWEQYNAVDALKKCEYKWRHNSQAAIESFCSDQRDKLGKLRVKEFFTADYANKRFSKTISPDETKCCKFNNKDCNPSRQKSGKVVFMVKARSGYTSKEVLITYVPATAYFELMHRMKATDHLVCRTFAVPPRGTGSDAPAPKCKVYSFPHSPPKHFSKTQRGRLIQSLHSGKCLDVFKSNKKNGANVSLWKCHGKKNQRWTLHHQGYIRSALNGKCLDVKDAARAGKNGANVMMWDCHGGKNQIWRSRAANRGTTQLVSLAPGASQWYLDVKGGKTSNGANAQIWKCHDKGEQASIHRWMVTDKPLIIRSFQNRHAGKCIDSTNKRSKGTKIHAWACNGKNVNQKWYLKKRPGGHFEIKSANSGLCLDVAGGSKNKGAQVLQWPCHGKANQQWIFIASAEKGWFRIRAKHSRKCLALTKANTKNGTPFRQWDCWKTKDQMFK